MTFDVQQNDAFRKVNSSKKQRYLDVRMTFDGRQNDAFKKVNSSEINTTLFERSNDV